METFKIKTENTNCRNITVEAIHIIDAIELALANYHGLIEEEITEVKRAINF